MTHFQHFVGTLYWFGIPRFLIADMTSKRNHAMFLVWGNGSDLSSCYSCIFSVW